MQFNCTRLFGAGLAMAATLATAAILPAAPAEAANERPLFIASAPARVHPSAGRVLFDSRRECDTRPLEAADVVLTQKSWKDLVRHQQVGQRHHQAETEWSTGRG